MQFLNKCVDATNAHTKKTTYQNHHTTAINALQDLRYIAWQHAINYRWDPVISQIHEEYLNLLNGILKECES